MEKIEIKLECLRLAESIYSTENPREYATYQSLGQSTPLIKAPKNAIRDMAQSLYDWVTEA